MVVFNYEAAEKFAKKHARARSSLAIWLDATLKATWRNFNEVKKTFRSADLYGSCVIFDIGGNNYRLIAEVDYDAEQVSINEVITHAEYDKDKWKKDC